MSNRPGQQFGNYRLIRSLGRGGFAEVFLGEHIYLQTQAAIKVMFTLVAENNVVDLRNEAYKNAHLIHPNIVRVLEFGVEGNIPYLVMDYAPGGTLRMRHPGRERLPLNIIRSYVAQVTAALQYAHQKKIIHRDIKPENMLIGEQNKILLSDFGIALIAQTSRSQNTEEFAGTVAYMSPEHIQGKPRLASDQYSLGIVVYEWLCGKRPFYGSFTELCTQQMFAPPPSLRRQVPTISPGIEQVVMRTLAKDPEQRFPDIQSFAGAFEQA
jgi:serine/threonine protein kinase